MKTYYRLKTYFHPIFSIAKLEIIKEKDHISYVKIVDYPKKRITFNGISMSLICLKKATYSFPTAHLSPIQPQKETNQHG